MYLKSIYKKSIKKVNAIIFLTFRVEDFLRRFFLVDPDFALFIAIERLRDAISRSLLPD